MSNASTKRLLRVAPLGGLLAALSTACYLLFPYAPDQFVETTIRAECHFWFSCCAAGEHDVAVARGFPDLSVYKDENHCVAERLEEGIPLNDLVLAVQQAESAGRFKFDVAAWQTCQQPRIDALNSCNADFVLGDAAPSVPESCSEIPPGTGLVPSNGDCFFDFECATPNSLCLPPSVLEEPCAVDDDCARGEFCDAGVCKPEDVVNVEDARVCIPPLGEGDDCSQDPDLPFLPPVCEEGTVCRVVNTDGDQECAPPAGEDDDCVLSSDCEIGLFCDFDGGVQGTCQPLKGEGDDCAAEEECEADLTCNLALQNPECEAPIPVDVFVCNGVQGKADPTYAVE